ncbi:MAG: hypothetical protein AAF614_22900 [Chloroflexota bacterium]
MDLLNRLHLIVVLMVLAVWTACSGVETAVLPTQDEPVPATAVVEPTAVSEPSIKPTVESGAEPPTAVVEPIVAISSQAEQLYYLVSLTVAHDNKLVILAGVTEKQ